MKLFLYLINIVGVNCFRSSYKNDAIVESNVSWFCSKNFAMDNLKMFILNFNNFVVSVTKYHISVFKKKRTGMKHTLAKTARAKMS